MLATILISSRNCLSVCLSTENIMRGLLSPLLCLSLLHTSSAGRGADLLQRLPGAGDVPCNGEGDIDIVVAGYNNKLGFYSVTEQEMVKLECNYR